MEFKTKEIQQLFIDDPDTPIQVAVSSQAGIITFKSPEKDVELYITPLHNFEFLATKIARSLIQFRAAKKRREDKEVKE